MVDDVVHGVVESRAGTDSGPQYGIAHSGAIIRWLGPHMDFVVKGNHYHPIIRTELVNEGDRSILNLFQLETRRSTGVDYQRYGERFFRRRKVSDFLLHAVFPNTKIFFGQIGNVLAVAIHNGDWNADQRSINSHDIAGAHLFRAGVPG